MRIICTVTNDLSFDRRMQRICRTLVAGGHDVTLVGRQLPASPPLKDESYRQHRLTCKHHKGKLFYLEYNKLLYQWLMQQEADVVCAIDLDTIIPCFEAAERKGWKKVYDAHEYFSEVPEVVNRPLVKFAWERIAARYIPKADLAYTVGPALAELMGKRYNKDFGVIRNVPDPVGAASATEERSYILYQGALNEGRGLEALLQAMQHIDMPLKIAGEGDLSQQLRQMAKVLQVEDKVTFLGFVQPQDLPQLTRNAWLGYNLLENRGLSYYYSLANKFFDYVQAEVPSLNMRFPEYERLNKEHEVSILLNDLSADAVTQAVKALQQQSEKYQFLRDQCSTARQLWNWHKEAEKLLTLYREI